MPGLKLFQISGSEVIELQSESAKIEKSLQEQIEPNFKIKQIAIILL